MLHRGAVNAELGQALAGAAQELATSPCAHRFRESQVHHDRLGPVGEGPDKVVHGHGRRVVVAVEALGGGALAVGVADGVDAVGCMGHAHVSFP